MEFLSNPKNSTIFSIFNVYVAGKRVFIDIGPKKMIQFKCIKIIKNALKYEKTWKKAIFSLFTRGLIEKLDNN